ncbi:C1 family peptidase [Roseiconus lacunae]|uniref:C1 family peptidase n=1 Tax=Roseiconus lacunae TaxID=2605694 RepID=A0ABT7PEM4_9BACT|nr:C1 family peptidase [Roseiconus lacunae]MDM4014952.1 C1 family peptidase [Roseiconus lacunae]
MSSENDESQFEYLVGGYPLEDESRVQLERDSTEAEMLMAGDLPEKVDPREHEKAGDGFLKVEHQESIGSCQGNALTDCGEFCFLLVFGYVMQFSRMFAYLVSQMVDGIRRDSGSTLSGGTKAAREVGFCPEAEAPYPSRYPGWGWVTDKMRKSAAAFKLLSHTVIESAEHAKRYLGSGIGVLQLGCAWGSAMDPDSDGCITRWAPGRGGHSVVIVGYVPDSVVGRRSSAGYWFLLKNSWGLRWGISGYAYVDPSVIDAMLRHRFTVLVGRSDMQSPKPKPERVDFTKVSRYGKVDPVVAICLAVLAGAMIAAMVGCGGMQPREANPIKPAWVPPPVSVLDPEPLADDVVHCVAAAQNREAIEELKARFGRMAKFVLDLESRVSETQKRKPAEKQSATKPQGDPESKRDRPAIGKPAIVMHTLPGCLPCEAWKKNERPKIESAGIEVFVYEDAKVAPTFDLFDGKEYFQRVKGYDPKRGLNTAKALLDRMGR